MSNINKYPRTSEQKIIRDIPAAIYQKLIEVSPICTVDILFFNPEKTHILLGKRVNDPYKGIFYTFGGRLHKNEIFEGAAIRIAKKETRIELALNDITFAGVINEINPNSIFTKTNYHAVVIYFGCIVPSDIKVELDTQHNEYQWFSVNDASLHQNIPPRINGVLKAIKNHRI